MGSNEEHGVLEQRMAAGTAASTWAGRSAGAKAPVEKAEADATSARRAVLRNIVRNCTHSTRVSRIRRLVRLRRYVDNDSWDLARSGMF
jgi:hypothetical protein